MASVFRAQNQGASGLRLFFGWQEPDSLDVVLAENTAFSARAPTIESSPSSSALKEARDSSRRVCSVWTLRVWRTWGRKRLFSADNLSLPLGQKRVELVNHLLLSLFVGPVFDDEDTSRQSPLDSDDEVGQADGLDDIIVGAVTHSLNRRSHVRLT